MVRVKALVAITIAMSVVSGFSRISAAQPSPQPPRFQTGVELTSMDVTVVDDRGKPVTTLTPADLAELQDRVGMAIQLISHNLGVVSEIADDIIVMYAGRIVERAAASELFANPRHPYTIGLIETLPSIEHRVARLPVITGSVPDPARMLASGCRFAARCPRAIPACREAEPPLVALAPGHLAACIRAAA